MRKFIYFILQIFAFIVFVLLAGILPTYFIEPINSFDWSQVETLENNQEIYIKISMIPAGLISLLFIVKIFVALIRIIKGNERVWIWRFSIRASLVLFVVALIPGTVIEGKLSEINKLKVKTAENISQKITKFVYDNPNDYIFYSNGNYEKKYEIFVSPEKISQQSEIFEDYLELYPPESHEGIERIDQLFNPQIQNYICEASAGKYHSKKFAIYKKNPSLDKHSLSFFDENEGKLRIYEEWTGGLSIGRMGGPSESYETATDFDRDGSMTKKTESRSAEVKQTDNILEFNEISREIQTGCWNSFECPIVTIGRTQFLDFICSKQTSVKDFYKNINSFR